jgi:hypothetical protein
MTGQKILAHPRSGGVGLLQCDRLMVRELSHTHSLTVSSLALASMKASVAFT